MELKLVPGIYYTPKYADELKQFRDQAAPYRRILWAKKAGIRPFLIFFGRKVFFFSGIFYFSTKKYFHKILEVLALFSGIKYLKILVKVGRPYFQVFVKGRKYL